MKKVLIGAIVGALFLAGISAYLMFRPTPENASDEVNNASVDLAKKENNPEAEPFSGVDSLKELMSRPGSYECTMSLNIDSGVPTATEGTFFFSGGKLRSDTVVDAGDMKVLTSVIIKDGMAYSWSNMDGVTQGVKMKIDQETKVEGPNVTAKEMEAIESDIKYDCKPWSGKDDSVFELPKDILFKDFEELINVGMEDGTVFASQCSACDELSGDAKAQCRAFMSCE